MGRRAGISLPGLIAAMAYQPCRCIRSYRGCSCAHLGRLAWECSHRHHDVAVLRTRTEALGTASNPKCDRHLRSIVTDNQPLTPVIASRHCQLSEVANGRADGRCAFGADVRIHAASPDSKTKSQPGHVRKPYSLSVTSTFSTWLTCHCCTFVTSNYENGSHTQPRAITAFSRLLLGYIVVDRLHFISTTLVPLSAHTLTSASRPLNHQPSGSFQSHHAFYPSSPCCGAPVFHCPTPIRS